MSLQHLSDEKLDEQTLESVKAETQSTLQVLRHLREVERRRLFSKLKFKSLYDYAERRLGYPYDQACRRIEAMRLLKELPEIENKIADGTLNLTNIGYARAAFKSEAKKDSPLCKEEKLEFLAQIENKSTRAVQKLVAQEFGSETLLRETVKPVTANISMLNLPVDDELLAKIEELKGLLAHSHSGISTSELFSYSLTIAIEKIKKEKSRSLQRKVSAPRLSDEAIENEINKEISSVKTQTLDRHEIPRQGLQDSPKVTNYLGSIAKDAVVQRRTIQVQTNGSLIGNRYIQAHARRTVWNRDKAECTNCGSKYALEIDHQIPFALGGNSNTENLRILCRNCNQRAAIEGYGYHKMSSYLRAPIRQYLL